MRYTIWENTPLKWHKFVTYIGLPLSAIASVYLLAVHAGDMMELWWAWDGTMTALGWLDIDYALLRVVLSVVASLGCLPSRRRWYGPLCVIALYAAAASYSLLCSAIYTYFQTPKDLIFQQFESFIGCSVAVVLNWIYYRKRRALFLPMIAKGAALRTDTGDEQKIPVSTIAESAEDQENSVVLLMKIQEDEEKKRRSEEQKDTNGSKRRSVPLWVAIALGVAFVACLAVCIAVSVDSANKISELQAENEKLEKNYKYQRERKVEATKKASELEKEVSFWSDRVVLVTEHGGKYHTYGCQYIEGKDFKIYNITAAIRAGYAPCSTCDPPKRPPLTLHWLD